MMMMSVKELNRKTNIASVKELNRKNNEKIILDLVGEKHIWNKIISYCDLQSIINMKLACGTYNEIISNMVCTKRLSKIININIAGNVMCIICSNCVNIYRLNDLMLINSLDNIKCDMNTKSVISNCGTNLILHNDIIFEIWNLVTKVKVNSVYIGCISEIMFVGCNLLLVTNSIGDNDIYNCETGLLFSDMSHISIGCRMYNSSDRYEQILCVLDNKVVVYDCVQKCVVKTLCDGSDDVDYQIGRNKILFQTKGCKKYVYDYNTCKLVSVIDIYYHNYYLSPSEDKLALFLHIKIIQNINLLKSQITIVDLSNNKTIFEIVVDDHYKVCCNSDIFITDVLICVCINGVLLIYDIEYNTPVFYFPNDCGTVLKYRICRNGYVMVWYTCGIISVWNIKSILTI